MVPAVVASTLAGIALFAGTVFLPLYLQLSLGRSPTAAGLLALPMIAGLLLSSVGSGLLISRTGRWKRFLVAGAVLMPVGLGLLSTIGAESSAVVVGLFMAVLGVGVGLLMQNLVLAAQNDVPAEQLGAATSVLSFFRGLGGAVGVSVLGAVLAHRVSSLTVERLGAAPGVAGPGAVPDLSRLPPDAVGVVRDVYGIASGDLFLVAAPVSVLALVAVLLIREKAPKTTDGRERRESERLLSQRPDAPATGTQPGRQGPADRTVVPGQDGSHVR